MVDVVFIILIHADVAEVSELVARRRVGVENVLVAAFVQGEVESAPFGLLSGVLGGIRRVRRGCQGQDAAHGVGGFDVLHHVEGRRRERRRCLRHLADERSCGADGFWNE